MNSRMLFGLIIFFLLALCSSAPATNNTVTVSGFVPSPSPKFQTIQFNKHTEATQAGCDEGRVYMDDSGDLNICTSSGGTTSYTYPTSSWKSSGNYIYPTATATNSSLKIGIGTSTPTEKLSILNGNFLASYQTGTSSQNNVLYFDTTNGTLIAGYKASTLAGLSGLTGAGSATLGYDSLASGVYSVAAGYMNTASGDNSFAAGTSSTASGEGSTALGRGATAAGAGSFTTGPSTANGKYSTAMGYGNTANGDLSAAIGYNNTTNNATSSAVIDAFIGSPTVVGAVAMGVSNNANGVGTVALGYGNTATGDYSGTLGYGITVTGSNSVGIGVGVAAKTFTASRALGLLGGQVMVTTNATTPAWWLGTVGGTLYVEGKIVSDNNSTLVSDIRMKTGITPISDALNRIQQLNPIQYHLIKSSMDETGHLIFDAKPENVLPQIHSGMAAQEVYKLFPDVVDKPDDESRGIWLMSYDDFIPILIQAVKEHKAETNELKTRIEALEAQIKALQK